MRIALRITVVLNAALMLGGCPPPSYGVSREFNVMRMPDVACIRDAIASTKGASNRREYESEPTKDIFGNPTPVVHHFWYWQNGAVPAAAVLSFEMAPDGGVHVRNFLMGPDERRVEGSISLVRPMMMELDANLTRKCHMEMAGGPLKERAL